MLLEVDVVVTKYKRLLFSFLLILVSTKNTFAEMMADGKTKFKLLFNLYHQNSDDGNQVYDNSGKEEANVVEPMLFVEHQITEDSAINAHFVFDFWTAASDTKLDGATGASGPGRKGQSRLSGNIGVRKEMGDWETSASVGFSSEYDYRSFNGSLGVQRSMAKDNFTLGLNIQYYKDKVKLFEDLSNPPTAKISDFLPRDIFAVSLTASQILTRQDIIQFDLTFVEASKNLESTASSVSVGGVRQPEVLPDTRSRYAISSKWVHGFSDEVAMNLSYRYYFDQWDLDAHTLRLAFLKEINDDEDYVEIALRYHNQSSVKYYQDSFATAKDYMTSDSDLADFSSYELSALLSSNYDSKNIYGIEFEDFVWNNGVTFAKRTNGLVYAYIQSSVGFQF
ncbi:DUF3570 domain-containing protein [Halobacteriovorax sp. ZH5_bin.2]|uniref:DUF3570 domain-containing protein n=1 Tax=unclassified Halobacteriovorax TaxID=2639665 RepID=UPI003722C5E3